MNERQRFALTVLAQYEGHPVEASRIGSEHWTQTMRGDDEDAKFKLRMATNPNIGWGRTLAWLAERGLVVRSLSDYSLTYWYEITEAGKEALR